MVKFFIELNICFIYIFEKKILYLKVDDKQVGLGHKQAKFLEFDTPTVL